MRNRYVSSPTFWGVLLGITAILVRLMIWLSYQPISYSDTRGGYMRLSEVLARGTLKGYDGTRVPGYPAFLAALGQQEEWIWIAQMLLGVAITLMLYWITWRTTQSIAMGWIVGGLYTLIPGQVFVESNLLTETLTTFFVVLSFMLLLIFLRTERLLSGLVLAFTLGISASAAGMVRALFYPLAVWLLIFVWLGGGEGWRVRLPKAAVYCLGPVLILGGWLIFIYDLSGMVSPTTRVGYNLVQHTGAFFEYLPDEYAPIRDTYLEYRDARQAERGVLHNTIWDALEPMAEASGNNFFSLSRELQRISWMLIARYPHLYLQSVAKGWVDFWKAPVVWRLSEIQPAALQTPLNVLAWVGRGISLVCNLVFLLISVGVVVSRKIRERLNIDLYTVAAIGAVWMTSVIQTLFEHGDNPRFLLPMQMIVVFVVVRSIWFWIQNRQFRGMEAVWTT